MVGCNRSKTLTFNSLTGCIFSRAFFKVTSTQAYSWHGVISLLASWSIQLGMNWTDLSYTWTSPLPHKEKSSHGQHKIIFLNCRQLYCRACCSPPLPTLRLTFSRLKIMCVVAFQSWRTISLPPAFLRNHLTWINGGSFAISSWCAEHQFSLR